MPLAPRDLCPSNNRHQQPQRFSRTFVEICVENSCFEGSLFWGREAGGGKRRGTIRFGGNRRAYWWSGPSRVLVRADAYVTPFKTACQIPGSSFCVQIRRGASGIAVKLWCGRAFRAFAKTRRRSFLSQNGCRVAEGYPAGIANRVTKARMAAITLKAIRRSRDLLTVMATRHCSK